MNAPTLGVLGLADPYDPPPPPEGFDDAKWFGYPVDYEIVPEAWARDVVAGKPDLAPAYAAAARRLEQRGVAAITANCGFAIAYQQAVSAAVSVPVACSSLLQLPRVAHMLKPGGRIGLLCFDTTQLHEEYLRAAGLNANVPLAIGGIEGTVSWRNWIAVETTTDWTALRTDVLGAARRLYAQYPDISHWVFECAGFPGLSKEVAVETGCPVCDWVTLCDGLMATLPRA
jgi:hypothetical protein